MEERDAAEMLAQIIEEMEKRIVILENFIGIGTSSIAKTLFSLLYVLEKKKVITLEEISEAVQMSQKTDIPDLKTAKSSLDLAKSVFAQMKEIELARKQVN